MEVALLAHEHMRGVQSDTIDVFEKKALKKLLQQVADNFTGEIKVKKGQFTNSFQIVESKDGFEVLDENSRKFVSTLENKLCEFQEEGTRVQAFQVWMQIANYEGDGESDVEDEDEGKSESDSDDEDYDVELGEEEEQDGEEAEEEEEEEEGEEEE